MLIQAFPSGPFATNAYVVACADTHKAAILDPGLESAAPIIRYIENHQLVAEKILLTHTHWDHIGDVAYLKKHLQLPVYVHEADAKNLRHPGSDGLPLLVPIEGIEPDGWLKEGDVVPIGNLKFKVIHTSGHSPGGICLYEQQHHILMSGDTLFKGTIGNLTFPTARPREMWKSLHRLAQLPSETQVFPGHGEKTTIGEENWLPDAEKIFGKG